MLHWTPAPAEEAQQAQRVQRDLDVTLFKAVLRPATPSEAQYVQALHPKSNSTATSGIPALTHNKNRCQQLE